MEAVAYERLIVYIPPDGLRFTPYRHTGFDEGGKIIYDSYAGVTPEQAQALTITENLTGKEAKERLWEIGFNDYVSAEEKKLVFAAFPDLPKRDKSALKPARTVRDVAIRKVLSQFGVTCPRCGGSGNYAKSVAYTKRFDGVCLRCNGSGKILPRLTDKKLAEIAAYFTDKEES